MGATAGVLPFLPENSKVLVIQWDWIIQLHPSAHWNWLRDSQFLGKCIIF